MPEHDVVKHTKEIIEKLKEPRLSWKHRLIDIMVEILIIVFAITLSLLLERWRENSHERTLEKKFLTGLRIDLTNDIQQLQSDSAAYSLLQNGWRYLRTSGINNTLLNKDSLNLYATTLLSTTGFIPNDSRFQALKSSGELIVIEDDSLQNMILDLYQNKITALKGSTDYVTMIKSDHVVPFIAKYLRYSKDGSTNLQDVIGMPEMQNYLSLGGLAAEAMQRYHEAVRASQEIIATINTQYGSE